MEALPEALLLEQRASFMEDLSRQHLWAYLPQPFRLTWQFLRLQVQWSYDNTTFSSKKYKRLRVTNPTQCDSHFVHLDRPCQRRLCTLFSGAHVGWAHFTAEYDLSSQDRAIGRKRTRCILQTSFFFERKSEREREIASLTGESSHARFGWPLFIAECNLPSQSSTELEQKS